MYFNIFRKQDDMFLGTVCANCLEDALKYGKDFAQSEVYGAQVSSWDKEDMI